MAFLRKSGEDIEDNDSLISIIYSPHLSWKLEASVTGKRSARTALLRRPRWVLKIVKVVLEAGAARRYTWFSWTK